MSCPHVAATAVLLKAAHPDWSAAAIRSAIMTTGTVSKAKNPVVLLRNFAHHAPRKEKRKTFAHHVHVCLRRLTATTSNAEGGPIMNGDGTAAGPMDYGSGHIRPRHALDPGLVYDASFQDYLLFACSSAGAGARLDSSFPCPAIPPRPHELNHPSLAVQGLNGSVTVRRTVTNVGQHGAHTALPWSSPRASPSRSRRRASASRVRGRRRRSR
jgi:hypothetical protein